MLIGYDDNGRIKFVFTDTGYLEKMYPNNTAKISNFWNCEHGLHEMFVDKIDGNVNDYVVVEGKLVYSPQSHTVRNDVETIQGRSNNVEEVK